MKADFSGLARLKESQIEPAAEGSEALEWHHRAHENGRDSDAVVPGPLGERWDERQGGGGGQARRASVVRLSWH